MGWRELQCRQFGEGTATYPKKEGSVFPGTAKDFPSHPNVFAASQKKSAVRYEKSKQDCFYHRQKFCNSVTAILIRWIGEQSGHMRSFNTFDNPHFEPESPASSQSSSYHVEGPDPCRRIETFQKGPLKGVSRVQRSPPHQRRARSHSVN